MTTPRIPLLAVLLLGLAGASSAAPDTARLAEHIHKVFSTPSGVSLSVEGLEPSPMKGWLQGRLVVRQGTQQQVQPLLVSEDGGRYFVGALYETAPSKVPGFKTLVQRAGGPPPPPLHVSPDGRHAVYGEPHELAVDPDADSLSKMKLKGVPSKGPADAPVVIVEYSDLQCPHCKNSHSIMKENLAAYEGKVRRVFKNYPLDMHKWAYDGAIALACAGKQGDKAFFAVKDAFFENQESVTVENLREKALGFAKSAGLDPEAFTRCFDKKESKALVEADVREGDAVGVTGTPSIFVNGRKTRHYQWEAVKDVLDEMLQKKGR